MIGLMDCNNFFVSCERLFRPDLVGKPVAVLSSNDGCIVARSQEVKALGIPMGAPYFQVKELCEKHGVTLFSGNLTLYRDISKRVMATLTDEVGEAEVYSVDEAFFEVPTHYTEADVFAIRERVWRDIGIPVSIGVAKTKTLAKYASEVGKRGVGVHILTAKVWAEAAKSVSTNDIWNLGASTARSLRDREVATVAEFMAVPRVQVEQLLGVHGVRIYDELHGTPVHTLHSNERIIRQSIASTRSLATTTSSLAVLESAVARHVEHVAAKLRQEGLVASTLVIQLRTSRHSDFFLRSRSVEVTIVSPTNETALLLRGALTAVRRSVDPAVPYKKTGVVATGLVPATCRTLDLFEAPAARPDGALDRLMDILNQYGKEPIVHYAITKQATVKTSAKLRSQNYTTLWKDIPTVQAK